MARTEHTVIYEKHIEKPQLGATMPIFLNASTLGVHYQKIKPNHHKERWRNKIL
jgi:hypothetical protein